MDRPARPSRQAKQLLFAGYPLRFTAAAQDVLPLIASGPPPYEGLLRQRGNVMTKEGWNGPATMDQAKMAGCLPEQILTIDAWGSGLSKPACNRVLWLKPVQSPSAPPRNWPQPGPRSEWDAGC